MSKELGLSEVDAQIMTQYWAAAAAAAAAAHLWPRHDGGLLRRLFNDVSHSLYNRINCQQLDGTDHLNENHLVFIHRRNHLQHNSSLLQLNQSHH